MQIVPISTNMLNMKCANSYLQFLQGSHGKLYNHSPFFTNSLNSVPISVLIYLKSKQAKGLDIHLQACSLSQILNVKLSLGYYG